MKRRNLILIAIVVGFIILIKLINLNYYRLSSNYSIYSNSIDSTDSTHFSETNTISNINTKESSFSVSASVSYNKDVYDTVNDSISQIKFRVRNSIKAFCTKSTSIGLKRFWPLYKPINFNSDIKYIGKLYANEPTTSVTGSFKIKGHVNITGICSASKAKQLVEDIINKEAQKIINEDLKSKYNKLNKSNFKTNKY